MSTHPSAGDGATPSTRALTIPPQEDRTGLQSVLVRGPLEIEAEDLPQADSVDTLLELVLATASGDSTAIDALDLRVREYRCYVSAGRSLGLLEGNGEPTPVGEALAEYRAAERMPRIAYAFAESRVGRAWRRWAGGNRSRPGLSS